MPDPIVALAEVFTRKYQRKVKSAAFNLREFEDDLEDLENIQGVRTYFPVGKGASARMDKASNVRKEVAKAMQKWTMEVYAESQVLVPVDTGTLKASAIPHKVESVGMRKLQAKVTYGEGALVNPKTGQLSRDYAIYVHERTELQHAPPTTAKFLEIAARGKAASLREDLAEAMREVWS